MRARCGSTEADPATLASEATSEDASVSSDRRAQELIRVGFSPNCPSAGVAWVQHASWFIMSATDTFEIAKEMIRRNPKDKELLGFVS
jgi:hypothetical protein